MIPSRTRALALAGAFACAAALVAPSHAAPVTTCGPGGTMENAGNGWLLSRPSFPSGPTQVTTVVSPAFDPNLIYATNGLVVVRSRDAGCSWKPVYTATPSLVGATAAVTALAAPSSANNSAYLYVGVTSSLLGVNKPSIAVSDRHGDRWLTTSTGLPDLGRVREIAGAPQFAQLAFAVIDGSLPAVVDQGALYSTTDAGAQWTQRTDTGGDFTPRQLLVDPGLQASVFGLDAGHTRHSIDNGETWPATPRDPGAATTLVAATGGGGVRLAAALSDGTGIARSDDRGASWRTVRTPEPPQSVALAPLQDIVAVSGPTQVSVMSGGQTMVVTPGEGGAPVQLAMSAPTSAGYALTGLASGGVYRATFQPGSIKPNIVPPGKLRPFLLLPLSPLAQFPSLMLPEQLTISLAAGESRTVPYRLLVPRTPTPADVMFLFDSTSSYQPYIDGLRQAAAGIVNSLNGAGLNVRFGIGNFEDYPMPYGPATASNVPYELRRAIGPSDQSFVEAVASIRAHDGTGDGGQSSLAAIYQSVTGAGEVVMGEQVIAKYQDAHFRAGSEKFVVVSTDTAPHYRGERVQDPNNVWHIEPGPSYSEVAAALRSRRVRLIGIPVPLDNGHGTSVDALQGLASESGALAPAGGVDCNGDGRIDLAVDSPLVCIIDSNTSAQSTGGLAAAITNLVSSAVDLKPVSLRVTRGAARARIVSKPMRVINLHADNELDFDVLLSCPRAAARQYDIALASATPTRSLADGAIALSCAGVPGQEPAPEEAVYPPRGAAANAVPDVKVNLNTNVNTNPNPNPQAGAQPVVNVNVGVAVSSQEQFQLALAEDNGARRPGEELAMSARPRDPGPGYAYASAAMLAAATGVAMRRRRQTAGVPARVRG